MDNRNNLKRNLKRVGWGLLAILWGATILFDFISFGAGLIGTGLVLLGVNVVRSIKHLHTKSDSMVLGILAIAWGGLELARPLLRRWFPSSDLDWVIFAILLMGLGVTWLLRALLFSRNAQTCIFITAHKE
jgi:hypothetical protein